MTQDPMADQIEKMLGGALYGVCRMLVDAGVRPAAALRLVGLLMIEGALGPRAIEQLGVPKSTANRWRAELAEAAQAADLPDDPTTEVLNEILPLVGLGDFALVKRPGDHRG